MSAGKFCFIFQEKCDFFLTTELSLIGYPPQDLLFRDDFLKKAEIYKQKIIKLTKKNSTIFLLNIPNKEKKEIYNTLFLIQSGSIIYKINKTILPNYGVFDEKRYFSSKKIDDGFFEFKKKKIKFLICEDMWSDEFISANKKKKFDLMVVINASPFEIDKFEMFN